MQTVLHIDDLHTPEMVDDEIAICLSEGSPLTLADFMLLRNIRSPYVFGGVPTEEDIRKAADILDIPESEADRFLRRQIAACNRAFDIIQSMPEASFQSSMPQLGPEWMTDLMTSAATACPALTPDVMLHGTPLVLLIHLAAAAHRKNGGTTRRPSDDAAALAALRELSRARGE